MLLEKSKDYDFSEEELNIIKELPLRLMESGLIKGEKNSTINR